MQARSAFQFTLWDVGHGLAIWIKTPSGHNHWIDAGKEGEFSPSAHVALYYGETDLDYLMISHPDNDHINDLANVEQFLGPPRVLLRNKTLPDYEKFESGFLKHQQTFMRLDNTYNANVPWERDPQNPAVNGGVEIATGMLSWATTGGNANNTSIVAFYLYKGWLFVMPGDIEESGWVSLWETHRHRWADVIARSEARVLVAPHHGRESGYSSSMFDNIKPHLTLISDKKAKAETCASFRNRPLGLEHDLVSRELEKPNRTRVRRIFEQPQRSGLLSLLSGTTTKRFISTKSGGRAQFMIDAAGSCRLHVVEK